MSLEAEIIDGVDHPETLIVMTEPTRSILLMRGLSDNVVVSLSADGWKQLAAVATREGERLEKVVAEEKPAIDLSLSDTWVGALIVRELRAKGLYSRDLAKLMRVDSDTMSKVVRGEGRLPSLFLTDLSIKLGASIEEIRKAWDRDNAEHGDVPIVSFQFHQKQKGRRR